jgi:valyl-tRNA synthetase
LTILDKWITIKLNQVISQVTEAYENFQFNVAIHLVRDFVWHKFCDQYIEAVKYRLYDDSNVNPVSKFSAQFVLRSTLLAVIQLLAPICPHMTEAIYQMFKDEKSPLSIHQTNWPEKNLNIDIVESEKEGDYLIEVISIIRRKKSELHIPLKSEIHKVIITCPKNIADIILKNKTVIEQTCRIQQIHFESKEDCKEISINIEK